VVVTGALGYLGRRLCSSLADKGYKVRILLSGLKEETDYFSSLGTEVLIGDVREKGMEDKLLDGASGVFNLAGIFGRLGMLESEIWEANVTIPKRLLKAATRAGVSRFLYCSSADVLGNVTRPPADEETPPAAEDLYQLTKAHGELSVLSSNGKKGLKSVVVRPTVVYGPGDPHRFRMFRSIAQGRYRMIGKGDNLIHPVYIDDLVEGMILAYRSDQSPGRVYILGGDRYLTLREWLAVIAREAQSSIPSIHYPYLPMKAVSILGEKTFWWFNLAPPKLKGRIEFFTKNRAYSIERAVTELDYRPKVDLAEGARRTLSGYRELGLL
jgi:nucleoside-diphosphate-sugar epimerase